MFYLSQLHNPNKHPLMPNEYPYLVSEIQHNETWVEISQEALNDLNAMDISDYQNAIVEEINLRIQNERRIFGESLVDCVTDKIGARNLTLIDGGTPVNIALLGSQMNTVATVIRGGAVVTGAGILTQMLPAFPDHADILQGCIDRINEFVAAQIGEQ